MANFFETFSGSPAQIGDAFDADEFDGTAFGLDDDDDDWYAQGRPLPAKELSSDDDTALPLKANGGLLEATMDEVVLLRVYGRVIEYIQDRLSRLEFQRGKDAFLFQDFLRAAFEDAIPLAATIFALQQQQGSSWILLSSFLSSQALGLDIVISDPDRARRRQIIVRLAARSTEPDAGLLLAKVGDLGLTAPFRRLVADAFRLLEGKLLA